MLSLLNTTFTNTLRQGSTLIGSLLSKLKARSTYFENKACTKNTLGDLNSEGLLEKASIITTPTAYSDGVLHSVKPAQTLGSELITNGYFATDSNWNKGIGWSISNNTAISDGSNTSGSIISQSIQLVEGKTYQVIVDVDSVDSGRVRFYSNFLGSGGQADITSSGTFTYNVKAIDTGNKNIGIQARDAGTQSVINSISVKELINADFTFTRGADLATRVNASGNVESIGVDLPRIDYRGGCGSWLLEPQATNTATDSNDFTTGDLFVLSSPPGVDSAILTSNEATSPDGTNNAWKLVDNNDGNTGVVQFRYYSTRVITNNYNTVSLFVKKQGNNDWVYIGLSGFDFSAQPTYFNISNGTIGNVGADVTASIDDYGNGWYRISATFQTEIDTSGAVQFRLATSNGGATILRDGTNGVYIYGIQAESDATRQYATSYIPTSGDPQTRGVDLATKAGSSDLINSTEGVFYAELKSIAEFVDAGSSISINNSTAQSRINIFKITTNNKLLIQVRAQNNSINFGYSSDTTNVDFDKVAIKWKSGDYAIWINGVEVATSTSTILPIGLNRVDFNGYTTTYQPFQGNVKCVAVFKEALTDAELTVLTAPNISRIFNERVLADGGIIESLDCIESVEFRFTDYYSRVINNGGIIESLECVTL